MQKKKGISLIVLVITIIVMIILAATIIISINNANVMEKANEAVEKNDLATVTEMANVAWGEAYLETNKTKEALTTAVQQKLMANGVDLSKYIIEIDTKGVKVGYGWVQDKATVKKGNKTLEVGQQVTGKEGELPDGYYWYLLGAENGKLLLTTQENIGVVIATEEDIWTKKEDGDYSIDDGSWGYLTVIRDLNNACENELKGNGSKVENIRSIKVEDIDRITGYDKIKTKQQAQTVVKQGTETKYYPPTRGMSILSGGSMIGETIVPNYYEYYPTTLTASSSGDIKGIKEQDKAYAMLFNNPYYCLASSYVYLDANDGNFGVRYVGEGKICTGAIWLIKDDHDSHDVDLIDYEVRPVICMTEDFVPAV